MARPFELGLKYFSHDTDMAYDRQMRKLTKKFSAFGYGVYLRVLECIYKQGHYVEYDDDFVFDIVDSLNFDNDEDVLVRTIIEYCAALGLFDQQMFTQNKILTSRSIQTRYFLAKEQSVTRSFKHENTPKYEYLLVDLSTIYDSKENSFENNSDSLENNTGYCEKNPDSVYFIKEKENKENIIKERLSPKVDNPKSFIIEKKNKSKKEVGIEFRMEDFKKTLEPYAEKYGQSMLDDFYRYWSEPNMSMTKMRCELEKTWSLQGRLATWYKNTQSRMNNGSNNNHNPTASIIDGLAEISKSRR